MGEGVLTSTQMIESIIVTLNSIPITGVENFVKIVECVQKLGALRQTFVDMEAKINDSHNNE